MSLLRVLKSRLEKLQEKRCGRFLLTLVIFSVFFHQLHIFAQYHTNHFGNEAAAENEEKIEVLKDPSLDYECQCKTLMGSAGTSPFACSDFTSLNRASSEQRLVSVSYYGQVEVGSLTQLSEAVAKHFPDYLLRIYHNVTQDSQDHAPLCQLFCQNEHIDLCNSGKIGQYGDSSKFFAPLWKYAPMSDPSVLEVHFRDADQVLSSRETNAIQDWKENSEANFIIMRDHPILHRFYVPKSMMGLRKSSEDLVNPLKAAYEKMMVYSRTVGQVDQLENLVLEGFIWPLAE